MRRWFRSLFAWRVVRDTGVWVYLQNDVTGARRVIRGDCNGHQPVDHEWVETGLWSEPGRPPSGGHDCFFADARRTSCFAPRPIDWAVHARARRTQHPVLQIK